MANFVFKLQKLFEEAAAAPSSERRVEVIVSELKELMEVDVCSLYILRGEFLVLTATVGLNKSAVGNVRLRVGEGLVGAIARTQHVINVRCASKHPDYAYFPESGEEKFEAFVGAPVVNHGELVGVLVVEQKERRKFSEKEESIVLTVAAHLGAVNPVDFFPPDPDVDEDSADAVGKACLKGVSGAPGVGVGYAILLVNAMGLLHTKDELADNCEKELESFRRAVEDVCEELAADQGKLSGCMSPDLLEVFDVHRMFLQSRDFVGRVEGWIEEGYTAIASLRKSVSDIASKFESMEDAYLGSRAEDIRSLGNQLYKHLCDSREVVGTVDGKIVLVGELVTIPDISRYGPQQIAGIVSFEGSALSHTVLLAKALGIPAVMGTGYSGEFVRGGVVVVDGYRGEVLLSPTPSARKAYEELARSEQMFYEKLGDLKHLPAKTPDGVRVGLLANTGLLSDISPGLAYGAEGVGLYRSEIPFLTRTSFPSEDEQVAVYRSVLEAYRGKPVCLRTLDVGGDKQLAYYPVEEENPALGWRGVRFSLDHTPVFLTQIRAMLRASGHDDDVHIMLPMVSLLEEVDAFLELHENAQEQLQQEGVWVKRPKIGIMVEVPAAASLLPFLQGKIDFISIGTNDLSQYLLAVDRNNARVARIFDHLHPAVLNEVEKIVTESSQLGFKVSVCGEMAADPCAAILLLAMKVDALSMAAFSIPKIKWLFRNVPHHEAVEQLEIVHGLGRPPQIRACLEEYLVKKGLGELLVPVSER